MHKNKTLFIIGVSALIISFLGVPNVWKLTLIRILGIVVLIIASTKVLSNRNGKSVNQKETESFVENGFSAKEDKELKEDMENYSEYGSQEKEQ